MEGKLCEADVQIANIRGLQESSEAKDTWMKHSRIWKGKVIRQRKEMTKIRQKKKA